MSTIYETLLTDLKKALKAKDTARLQVLRSIKAKLMEKEISERKGGKVSLNQEQVQEVLMKAAKQRRDSIAQYSEAGRSDLAESEEYELKIIESYLPEMLSEEEIQVLATQIIRQTQASSLADMGKVMGILMPQVKGKVDGAVVNRIVRELVNKL
ncbi:MAG: GatB/YqeY domain-containing protein [Balneolales bacterium]